MADETTTPVAAETVPTEHSATPVDPNAIEQALELLAADPEPTVEPATEEPKNDEVFEPLGNITSRP
ncbi:hypothetical protein [Kitasatospora terrestris]|uniref:Uncharacterized protein n=1 Tax=Kitasatospora terrestris TaxID=258051 RepID=A0ABP9E126_9ACTN